MKSVVFLINSLQGGGAERLLQALSQELVRRGVRVEIVTIEQPDVAYEFSPEVRISTLRTHLLNRGLLKILGLPIFALELRYRLWQRKPDAVMSLLVRANFVAVLSKLLGYKGKLVVSDHADILACYPSRFGSDLVMKTLAAKLYPIADRIVAVSEGVARSLATLIGSDRSITTIYNAVDVSAITREAKGAHARPSTFATVGRLAAQKDHQTLILAFVEVLRETPRAKLVIVGDGPERDRVQDLIFQHNLCGCVELVGWCTKPFRAIGGADVFVLSSRFEGFGLVLVEAMAAGLPVVSTRCPSGPAEILENGHCGLLVEVGNHHALAEAMLRLIKDNVLSQRFRERGLKRCQDFDVSKVCDRYVELLFS